MSFLSDLDPLKIEAAFHLDHVIHTEYRSDRAQGLRRARIVKKWYRQCKLGFGTFGHVWLEFESSNAAQLRAVKVIQKDLLRQSRHRLRPRVEGVDRVLKAKGTTPMTLASFPMDSAGASCY